LQSVACSCQLNGYSRQWELTRQTTVHFYFNGRDAYLTGPEYPNDIVRAYDLGDAGKKACEDLAKAHLKETKCEFDVNKEYHTVDGTIADVEKKYGAVPLKLHLDINPKPPETCLNVTGVYEFDAKTSCHFLKSQSGEGEGQGYPYYLPFPVGKIGSGRIEIRQDGCKAVRVIVSDPDPNTHVLAINGGDAAELRYDAPSQILEDDGPFDHKYVSEYFSLTKVGGELRVLTGHWQNRGSSSIHTVSWSSADCHLKPVSH
jgi:hypothetical protein